MAKIILPLNIKLLKKIIYVHCSAHKQYQRLKDRAAARDDDKLGLDANGNDKFVPYRLAHIKNHLRELSQVSHCLILDTEDDASLEANIAKIIAYINEPTASIEINPVVNNDVLDALTLENAFFYKISYNQAMDMYKYVGFSLIELMVVIAIVGLISAIAVPSYKAYIVKAKTAEKVVLAFNLLDGLIVQHQSKGTFPDTIDFAGTTVAAGSHWQVINTNSQGLIGLNYNKTGNTVSLQLNFSGLDGIPGYAPTAGNPNGNGYSSFVVGALDNGTTVRKVCGQAPYINQDIPFEYLPASCNCISVDNYLSTGTGC